MRWDMVLTCVIDCICTMLDLDKNKNYPPILVTTSTRDDHVHPGHVRKFVKVREQLFKTELCHLLFHYLLSRK